MKEEFLSHFASYSNAELLLVLHRKDQYQAEAIAAVKEILESRVVTESDQYEAWQVIKKEAQLLQAKTERKDELRSSAGRFARSFMAAPDSHEAQKLRMFCLGLTIIFLFQFFGNINLTISWSHYVNAINPFSLFIIGYYGLQALSIFLLFRQKKWGWILVTFAAAANLTGDVWMMMSVLFNGGGRGFFAGPGLYNILVSLLIHTLILYYLNTVSLMALLNINRRTRLATIIVGVILAIFVPYLVMIW